MSEVRIRNLPDDVKAMLKRQAVSQGQNLEAYLRGVLCEQAFRKRREWADRLKELRNELYQKYGLFSDSAALIRQDRDERG